MRIRKTTLVWALALTLALSLSAAASFNEAPMLQELVEQGALPPVEDRLPAEPMIVGPGTLVIEENIDWEAGQYGGTLRTVHTNPDFSPDAAQGNLVTMLNVPGITLDQISDAVVAEFSVNEDATEFTFTLREGLRWSDGHPVTTEDVRFAFEDVFSNAELYPSFPNHLRSGGVSQGEPMELEIVDELTFRYISAVPYGALLTNMGTRWPGPGVPGFMKPAHFLKDFHIDYTSLEELRPYLEEEELTDEWHTLFATKDIGSFDTTSRRAIGFPVLSAWQRVESAPGVIALERNPYYFKVDIEGNQLPYIDRIESHEVSDMETTVMRVITGEVDYLREAAGLPHMPLYREHMDEAGFTPHLFRRILSPTTLFLNHTYDDPIWQEVVSDLRFRQALSLALDREEIIDTVKFGHASMPEWVAEEFSQFDPDRAEALLDEMGMDQRDSDGYRLSPSGEPFELRLEVAPGIAEIIPTSELVAEYLQDIGLNASMREIGWSLMWQRIGANEMQASVGWLHPGGWPEVSNDYQMGIWGSGTDWQTWYNTDGESGQEPPEWAMVGWNVYEEVQQTRPDDPYIEELRDELMQWYHDYFPTIIITEEIRDPLITAANLGNVAKGGFAIPAYMPVEQMFFRQ